MLSKLRRFISPELKERILNSLIFRLYFRFINRSKEIRFSVEVTTKCNINCAMCTRMEMLKKGKLVVKEMDPEIIEKIIDEMDKFIKNGYKVTFVPMGLGEPLLYSELKNVIEKVRQVSEKIKIILVTNGVCLTQEVANDLVKLKVNEISVSLNVNNASDYKKYMRADNYPKIKKNIENLIKIRNESGFEIPSIYIQYLDYLNSGNKFNKNIKNWTKIMKYDDKCYVHPIVNQAGFKDNGLEESRVEDFPCNSPLTRVAIRINGDIYPCDACFYGGSQRVSELYLGNVKKESIFNIFNNKKSKNFRIIEMMKNCDYSKLPTCKKCDTYKLGVNCFFKNPITKRWM